MSEVPLYSFPSEKLILGSGCGAPIGPHLIHIKIVEYVLYPR